MHNDALNFWTNAISRGICVAKSKQGCEHSPNHPETLLMERIPLIYRRHVCRAGLESSQRTFGPREKREKPIDVCLVTTTEGSTTRRDLQITLDSTLERTPASSLELSRF